MTSERSGTRFLIRSAVAEGGYLNWVRTIIRTTLDRLVPERGAGSQSRELDFSFVSDSEIRGLLADDYRQAWSAHDARAYVGAVALAGGAPEGPLTWALISRKGAAEQGYAEVYGDRLRKQRLKQPPPVEEWKLVELIEVCMRLGLLSDRAKKTAHAVQEFRNYIHPYTARRSKSWTADESLSLIALNLVEKFSQSLTGRLDQPPRSAG